MSDFRAVATVTAALQRLLQTAVGADVPGALAWTDRPDAHQSADANGPGVNIYAYQVTSEPTQRNSDLPTRGPSGQVVRRPQAALALHYLMSFYGDDGELEPQRVLGSVVRTLHARPIITRALITTVTDAAKDNPPIHPSLADSDLADQIDVVRVSPLALNLEELSKLWSVFFQVPYALSMAYQASIVFIDEPVQPAGSSPVLQPDLTLGVLSTPRLSSAEAVAGGPVGITDTLAIRGTGLAGGTPTVQVGRTAVPPASIAANLITIPLSTVSGLRAGPVPVTVRLSPLGEESNVISFLLRPAISTIVAGGTATDGQIAVDVAPPLGADQVAALSLLAPGSGERVRVFPAQARTSDVTRLTVPIGGLEQGQYIVQLSVDGAASMPERDPAGQVTGPVVTLP